VNPDSEGHGSSTTTLRDTTVEKLLTGEPKYVNVHEAGTGNPPILTCADLNEAGSQPPSRPYSPTGEKRNPLKFTASHRPGQPAVHAQVLARDVGSIGRDEERHALRDLLDRARPLHRYRRAGLLFHLKALYEAG
jgi:hypothetical protein